MMSIWKLEDGECHLDHFDRKRKPKMTTIKEYREQSIQLDLTEGRYMIVPRQRLLFFITHNILVVKTLVSTLSSS